MNRRLIPLALVPFTLILGLALGLVLPSDLGAAETPPRDLRQVGDHWTAWNPPTSFPEGTDVHTIVRGDTLWNLAARFYGDPYLWPQLWEQNQYILDAHWIYPGDPLVVGVTVTPMEELETVDLGDDPSLPGEERQEEMEAMDGVLDRKIAAGQPIALGSESDIYCSGFIGAEDEVFPHRIIGSEHEALAGSSAAEDWQITGIQSIYGSAESLKFAMATGDIVYVDGGRAAGLSPGSLYTIVAPGGRVRHPLTSEWFGRQYSYTGRLRVLSVQDTTAIAEIVASCDGVVVGSMLRPFEAEPVPLARPGAQRPVNFPPSIETLSEAPVILSAKDEVVALGQDNVVYLDLGIDDDVAPGDIYSIYRMHRTNLPPVLVGELAVLAVRGESAVARIIESRYTVYPGDRLLLK